MSPPRSWLPPPTGHPDSPCQGAPIPSHGLRASFLGPSTWSCPVVHRGGWHAWPGLVGPPYLSVEVQEPSGAVDVVERGKGVDGAIDAHGVQPQGPPASHQQPVGRGTADEHLGADSVRKPLTLWGEAPCSPTLPRRAAGLPQSSRKYPQSSGIAPRGRGAPSPPPCYPLPPSSWTALASSPGS